MKCSNKSIKRNILTPEQAEAVFKIEWENDSAKLANAVAMYTGMRSGEIAALRYEDIGKDCLYVKHSWSKYEGIKCCKNGEERICPIATQLRDALIMQANMNPHGEELAGFVFFGIKPKMPTDNKNWNKYLRRALLAIGYSNPMEICFHSWRHFWVSRMSDQITDKRIIMLGSGHKTIAMLDHYADHVQDSALQTLQDTEQKLFASMIEFTS